MKSKKVLLIICVICFGISGFLFFQNLAKNKPAQNLSNDCGPQALHSILLELEINTTIEKVEELADTDEEGTTMLGLYEAARDFGLKAMGMRLSYGELQSYVQHGDKVIAFVNNDHYVYVKKTHPDGIVYKDIDPGYQFAREEEWKQMWYEKDGDGENLPHGTCLVISPK